MFAGWSQTLHDEGGFTLTKSPHHGCLRHFRTLLGLRAVHELRRYRHVRRAEGRLFCLRDSCAPYSELRSDATRSLLASLGPSGRIGTESPSQTRSS
jgi:hypothetical protein